MAAYFLFKASPSEEKYFSKEGDLSKYDLPNADQPAEVIQNCFNEYANWYGNILSECKSQIAEVESMGGDLLTANMAVIIYNNNTTNDPFIPEGRYTKNTVNICALAYGIGAATCLFYEE